MRFAIYSKVDNHNIDKMLIQYGHVMDNINPEVVISVGGDGTMLGAIHRYMNLIDRVMFVGVNFGRLGFYTDFSQDEIIDLIAMINQKEFITQDYNLLETVIHTSNEIITEYALNEVSLINAKHTQVIEVFINDEHFESFRGTGFIISTPSGSTAFNKSLGGSVIEPKLKTMQLTEIASINNRLYKTISSPIVLSSETIIKLVADYANMIISIDGNDANISHVESIEARISTKKVKFIVKEVNSFWRRVKKSFLK